MDVTATVWTLLPPIIAIALALITKEVYSSLMIGILSGALLYTGFHPLKAVETTFTIMGSKLGDNINICIFLVLLGILVSLITKSGASRAYGEWAVKTIRSRRGASFATSFLGMFIFVDDYFNCLTVGTVMRPVTVCGHVHCACRDGRHGQHRRCGNRADARRSGRGILAVGKRICRHDDRVRGEHARHALP